MIVEILNELERTGKLRPLLSAGLISPKVIFYREVYLLVLSKIEIHKQTKGTAESEAAEELRITERTVRRAIRCMKAHALAEETHTH